MAGTYALTSSTGGTFVLLREEVERLVNVATCSEVRYRLTNLVTQKTVAFSDRRPLTFADIARISNEE